MQRFWATSYHKRRKYWFFNFLTLKKPWPWHTGWNSKSILAFMSHNWCNSHMGRIPSNAPHMRIELPGTEKNTIILTFWPWKTFTVKYGIKFKVNTIFFESEFLSKLTDSTKCTPFENRVTTETEKTLLFLLMDLVKILTVKYEIKVNTCFYEW